MRIPKEAIPVKIAVPGATAFFNVAFRYHEPWQHTFPSDPVFTNPAWWRDRQQGQCDRLHQGPREAALAGACPPHVQRAGRQSPDDPDSGQGQGCDVEGIVSRRDAQRRQLTQALRRRRRAACRSASPRPGRNRRGSG